MLKKAPKNPKIVWITGASRGIGKALALEYAKKEDAKLILSAPESEVEHLHDVATACHGINGHGHLVLPFDLADRHSIDLAFQTAKSTMKHIDILVNNAGITHRSHIVDTEMQVYDTVMNVNFLGPVALTKQVLALMLEQQKLSDTNYSPKIVIMCSINGIIPTPHRAAYIASKFAMHGWSESLRDEIMPYGIDVTAIFPGFVNTDIGIHALTGDGGKHGKAGSQSNGIEPSELAKQVVKANRKGKKRVHIAGREGLLVPLKRLSPELVQQIIRRVDVT